MITNILNHPLATEEMADKAFNKASKGKLRSIVESRAFSKKLFNKYIDHPELSSYMTDSRHFNNWVSKVGFDHALSHPNEIVVREATIHSDFKNWVSKVGFDHAFSHPNYHVGWAAATYHPDFKNWVSKVGFDYALNHPNYYVVYRAANHPDFNKWVSKVGIDHALNHPNGHVRAAAEQLKDNAN